MIAKFRTPDLRVRLIACTDSAAPAAELVAMLSWIATISIPPLTEDRAPG